MTDTEKVNETKQYIIAELEGLNNRIDMQVSIVTVWWSKVDKCFRCSISLEEKQEVQS